VSSAALVATCPRALYVSVIVSLLRVVVVST
jgi:hypothetical protein